jgi:PadR family transcriptional regulator, regulatory protein PadR
MTPSIDSTSLYGTLNLLVLSALSDGPLHGLAILRCIVDGSGEELRVEEGALYPALHRLERDGLLEAEWGRTEQNRRARFYRLSARGRKRLERERARWMRHTEVVARLITSTSLE